MLGSDIIELLGKKEYNNVICSNFEYKPTTLAMYIAALANSAEQYGFIFIGITLNRDSYDIKGISKEINIKEPLGKAIALLANPPKIEYQRVSVNDKEVLVIKVYKNEDNVFFNFNLNDNNKIDIFIKDLLRSCVKLQANILYRNKEENERNDYIRDLLSMRGYVIKDQTRRGYSATGKSTGEIDIFVESDDLPFSVVEALILDSLNRDYLNKHLDKIYSYDTTGNKFNVCLTYVEAKDFGAFWNKYCEHVSTYSYPVTMVECKKDADKDFTYSEIRFMTTSHNRNGKMTLLYHIAVKM